MAVREAVEACGATFGISPHLLEIKPVPDIQQTVQLDVMSDHINTIAGGTPDGIGDSVRCGAIRRAVFGPIRTAEDLRDRILMIKDPVGRHSDTHHPQGTGNLPAACEIKGR